MMNSAFFYLNGTIRSVIMDRSVPLVAVEQVSCVYFFYDIIQTVIVSVGDDGITLLLEFLEVIYDFASEERRVIGKRWLVDDDVGAFGFDSFHDTLYRTLTEVVGVAFHSQSIDTYGDLFFMGLIIGVYFVVIIITGHLQNLIGDEIFSGAVALYDGRHHVLRDI